MQKKPEKVHQHVMRERRGVKDLKFSNSKKPGFAGRSVRKK